MSDDQYDVLVIGSGVAGLVYAIHCAAFARVLVLTKGNLQESNTRYAQGGIATVVDSVDAIENHLRDTLVTGDGLSDPEVSRMMVESARDAIKDLELQGVRFDKASNGKYDLHREGGHSFARVVHHADSTGNEVESSLVKQLRNHPRVTVLEDHFVVDLLVAEKKCYGAMALTLGNDLKFFYSKITMLATGGLGQLFLRNTNPKIATGDGYAMAYRAGAKLADMEFIQFHPTTLYAPGHEVFLITEALRGFGAELKNVAGEAFMYGQHLLGSLAPRDIVSRAIFSEMERTGSPCVYLDLQHLSEQDVKKHFPSIVRHCQDAGISLPKDKIPVAPAAHYICGGVVSDEWGRTSIDKLFVCGETACTFVHGANRLASNSLLEGAVFAKRASQQTEHELKFLVAPEYRYFQFQQIDKQTTEATVTGVKHWLRTLMWQNAGIIRNRRDLNYCLQELNELQRSIEKEISLKGISKSYGELKNMVTAGKLLVRSAMLRQESRGCHYRSDYPRKKAIASHTIISADSEKQVGEVL